MSDLERGTRNLQQPYSVMALIITIAIASVDAKAIPSPKALNGEPGTPNKDTPRVKTKRRELKINNTGKTYETTVFQTSKGLTPYTYRL